jgi:hypothetical protein
MMGLEKQSDHSTAAVAMSYTFAPGKKFTFEEVRIHLSAASATSENFVITIQSAKGSAYNVVLYTQDMDTVQDLVYQPTKEHELNDGDSLLFTWTNTNLRTYGMEIQYKATI